MAKTTIIRKHRQLCVGDLNKRIKILSRTLTVPEFETTDLSEKFSGTKEVWASVVTTTGQTVFVINQDVSFTHKFSIRYDSQVNSENWIRFEGDNYRIIDIQDLEERHEWLVMRCVATGDADIEAAQA